MRDNKLVGCGVATNGKITRVVGWYGKFKDDQNQQNQNQQNHGKIEF